ncbi:MAG: hypothetical protein IT260_06500 [Saprospiraceae bacterium]|nr:hypothetical protein [Saprospiraceae bacterium]
MKQLSFFQSPVLPLVLIGVVAVFAAWLWFFQPDCYVPVVRYEQQHRIVVDTFPGPASCQILDISSSDVIAGTRPRKADNLWWQAVKTLTETAGGKFNESFHYINQTVELQNTAIDTAVFALAGWVEITALPGAPIFAPLQKKRLAPGQSGTFKFLIELPEGYDYHILEQPTLDNIGIQASRVRCLRKKEIIEWVAVKKVCNRCRTVCEDQPRPPGE